MTTVRIVPVLGLPEIGKDDDLAALITEHAEMVAGDVVVVAQKIVSKAEGALVSVPDGRALAEYRLALARQQAQRVVVDAPGVLVVRTPHGYVCANAGIDASNTGSDDTGLDADSGTLILLPKDPDASARELRDGLVQRTGVHLGVVVTDTFGRPWRHGQTDVAIGVAGIRCIRDERSLLDRAGRKLEVTEIAVVDEIAAAADLVRRKADGVPVVIVRGLDWDPDADAAAADLVRPVTTDMFPRGRGELGRALAQPTGLRPLDTSAVRRVVDDAHSLVPTDVRFALDTSTLPWTVRPSLLGRTAEQFRDYAVLGAAAATVCAVLVDAGWAARSALEPEPLVSIERSPVDPERT